MPKPNVANNIAYQVPTFPGQPDFWVRGKEEEWTIQEQSYYTRLNVVPGDIAMDVGAHIGCTARWLLNRGAAEVHCYEPMPNNFEILEKNAEGLPIHPYRAAIVPGHEPTLEMWTPNTKFSTVHSYIHKKGRTRTVVNALSFLTELDKCSPTVLKMDTEGGELLLVDQFQEIHHTVRSVAMEIHYSRDDARDLARRLMAIMAEHYDVIQAPKYLDKAWNTDIVIWERKS